MIHCAKHLGSGHHCAYRKGHKGPCGSVRKLKGMVTGPRLMDRCGWYTLEHVKPGLLGVDMLGVSINLEWLDAEYERLKAYYSARNSASWDGR